MNIQEFFQNYKENKKAYWEVEEKLLNLSNKEEWFDLITDKAIMTSQVFAENKAALEEYSSYIARHGEGGHYTREEADTLLGCLLDMYYDDCDDYEIMMKAIDPLINYYKREHDFSNLVKLHSIRNYELVEFLSRQSEDVSVELVLSDALSAISYKAYFQDLDDEAKRKIFSNYYNIINVNLDKDHADLTLSYYYLIEAMNFWNSPMLTDKDREDEKNRNVITRSKEEWLATYEKLDDSPIQVQEFYKKTSDEVYQKYFDIEGSEEKIGHEIVVSHYKTAVLRGEITAEEGLKKIVDYYLARKNYLSGKEMKTGGRLIDMSFEYIDYLYFFINVPVSVLTWIEVHNISTEDYAQYMSIFLKDLHEKWDELYLNLPAPFLDNYIMEICLSLIPYSVSEEEQELWLKKLLLKRHLPTFIHTNMVAALAVTIASHIIDKAPHILVCKDWPLERIQKEKEGLLAYIRDASLFHDLGKSRIGDIINTQTRPISNSEFDLIKSHPSFGVKYTSKAPFLEKYNDVILGHHKFYDGKGGYPESFDNTVSGIRSIIDLVTICDCLDAATDFLSRNYNTAKTIDVVYKEIYDGRGTRYNPLMAEFLLENNDLKTEIDKLTGEGRIQKYYEIYEEYLAH